MTKNFRVHAMIDLSDGLGADLPRLARASKVGFEIDENSLPRNPGATIRDAIVDGEDYELLFAISPRHRQKLQSAWPKKFPKLRLTRIGRFNRKSKIKKPVLSDSRTDRKLKGGYVHFQ